MKSFTAALLASIAVIFPSIVADVDLSGLRYLDVYGAPHYEGPHARFQDYVPDLSVYSLDNGIVSICYTGFWILYTEYNYENFLGNFSGINGCTDYTALHFYEASSLRYSGSPGGINDVYYNLYESDYFVGPEFRGNTDAPTLGELDLNVSSLVIFGQSPWTFFTDIDYNGLAVCLYPDFIESGDDDIHMVYYNINTMSDLSLPDNSIRSVARGCLSERIVGLPPSEASLRPEGDHKLTNNVH